MTREKNLSITYYIQGVKNPKQRDKIKTILKASRANVSSPTQDRNTRITPNFLSTTFNNRKS